MEREHCSCSIIHGGDKKEPNDVDPKCTKTYYKTNNYLGPALGFEGFLRGKRKVVFQFWIKIKNGLPI